MDFVIDRFSTPEKASNTLEGIGILFSAAGIIAIPCPPLAGVFSAFGVAFSGAAWIIEVMNEE